jgi:hypothetical protein
MKKVISTSLLLTLFLSIYGYSWLNVNNPHSASWNSGQGSIDEATLTIEPKGAFMEYGVYLTFSAKNAGYSESDTLEITYSFELPGNSMIQDAWLWIDGKIIKAIHIDRSKASKIYENIVKRVRRDPLILYKNYENNYQLSIYPLFYSQTRKIKLSFLIPAQFGNNYCSAWLPLDMVSCSKIPTDKLKVYVKNDPLWTNPRILNNNQIQFENTQVDPLGPCKGATINLLGLSGITNITFDSPLKNGYLINTYSKNGEGFFEFVAMPSEIMNFQQSRKFLFLIDNDTANYYQYYYYEDMATRSYYEQRNVGMDKILTSVKQYILQNLTPNDEFNVIVAQDNIVKASNSWLKASPENIDDAFNEFDFGYKGVTNNLIQLTSEGINFIKSNGNQGDILLLTNTIESRWQNDSAEVFVNRLKAINGEIKPLNIVDNSDLHNYDYYSSLEINRWTNSYFLSEIAALTNGKYVSVSYCNMLGKSIEYLVKELSPSINFFEMFLTTASGRCYARFDIGNTIQDGSTNIEDPVIQVGKYVGVPPFKMQIVGEFNGNYISLSVDLSNLEINTVDSVVKKIWAGCYINKLESGYNSNNKNEIVNYSIGNRILSRYTAFLALEPNDTISECSTCTPPSENSGTTTDALSDGNKATTNYVSSEAVRSDNSATYLSGYAQGVKVSSDSSYIKGYKEGIVNCETNVSSLSGIEKITITLSPNPFSDKLKIRLVTRDDYQQQTIKVSIIDITGKSLFENTLDVNSGSGTYELEWNGKINNGNSAASGSYFLVIKDNSNIYKKKIFKVE